jgi:hypothetical protein
MLKNISNNATLTLDMINPDTLNRQTDNEMGWQA